MPKTKTRIKLGKKTLTSMPIKVKAIDKENFTLTMVASTQDVDRHGDTILQKGWDLGPFEKNPVILNSHNYSDATEVIARATRSEIKGKGKRAKLEQDWVFAVKENPKAKIIFDLYAGGFLHASSVGFIPRKFAEKPDGSRDWFIIEEAELLEVSAVSVPANAMALAKAKGIDVEELTKDYEDNEDDEEEDTDECVDEIEVDEGKDEDNSDDSEGEPGEEDDEGDGVIPDDEEDEDEGSEDEEDEEPIEEPNPINSPDVEKAASPLEKIVKAIKHVDGELTKVETRPEDVRANNRRLINKAIRDLTKMKKSV